MADVPNVQLINFIDTTLSIQFDASGEATAMLTSPNNPTVDLTGFRKINILGPHGQNFLCRMLMGQIVPGTMAATYAVPLDGKIHTFEVHGPQMMVEFTNGPTNTTTQIQFMIYLRS